MKKYVFLLALAPILVGVTLYLVRNIDNTKQSTTAGDKFYQVLFSKKENNIPLEEIDANWRHLANFEHAFNHISDSTSADATSIYSNVAGNKEAPNILRELAQYLEVMQSLRLNNEKIDNEKLESSAIYHYSSKEAIAIIKIRNKDTKGAVKILRSLLNDRKCPILIKANAEELLRIYEN